MKKSWHRSDNIPAQNVYNLRAKTPENVYGTKIVEVVRVGGRVDWNTARHYGYLQSSQQKNI